MRIPRPVSFRLASGIVPMATNPNVLTPQTGGEDFASLLDAYLGANTAFVGSIINGLVLRVEGDVAVIDVGLKSEGRIPLKEFAPPGEMAELHAGDRIGRSTAAAGSTT